MAQIMVTILDSRTEMQYDVEVPDDLEIGLLTDDLTQALIGMNSTLSWDPGKVKLIDSRLNKQLNPASCLVDQGVWNGDYLIMVE